MSMRASVLLLALAGCDLIGGDGPPSLPAVDARAAVAAEAAALLEARAAWEASGIRDYELSYDRSCFCIGTRFQVRVVDGAVVEFWVDGEVPVTDAGFEGKTVDALFAIAADALDRADAASARVLPDRVPYFYSISADYNFEMADEEVAYTVTGFRATD